MAFLSTNRRDGAGRLSKAIPSAARSFTAAVNQLQTWTDASFAFRRPSPAAVNQLQDRSSLLPARAGLSRVDALTNGPVRFFSSRRIGQHLRGRANLAAPRLFISCAGFGSRRSLRHSLPRQPILKCIADVDHIHLSLSKSPLRPDQYGRKDFQNAGNIFQEGARQNDR